MLLVAGIGLLIGSVGLGGFLMVPVLMFVEGATVRQAVVTAAVAFLASGLVSAALWRRDAEGDVRPYRTYFLAAAPGAMIGALVVDAIVDGVLTVVIATTFLAAGIAEWLGLPRMTRVRQVATGTAVAGGLATGFGSALTGTSGPMVAMPLLAWAGLPLRERITLGQVAQVPIALGATLVFAGFGDVPWPLAVASGVALCAGLVAGTLFTRRRGIAWLRRAAALLMIGAAFSMLAKL